METLGEDLLLLLIGLQDGLVNNVRRVNYGLAGAEVVRLAACGRIDIVSGQIVVLDATSTGDPLLDLALESIIATKIKPLASTWVGSPRLNIRREYLDRLAAAGVLHGRPHERAVLVPVTRWEITDPGRLADARGRLDEIARSAGPLSQEQMAFGGLAFAVGLDRHLYPGWSGRKLRKRLAQIAAGEPAAATAARAARAAQPAQPQPSGPGPEIFPLVEADPGPPGTEPGQHRGHPHTPGGGDTPQPAHPGTGSATHAVTDAVTQAATGAATDAAVQAATQAATHAATHAAVQAATHAAVSAAHHAADTASGGHGGGGHGGHGGGGHGGGGADAGGGGHHH